MKRVEFVNVSKRYVLGERHTTARASLAAASRSLMRREPVQPEEIWSLRDVSFDVSDGEALGLIGRNGAGKSTALKILSRISTPTKGSARTRGRVATLLEVGTGFQPELTGRENIFLNGTVLGMRRREVAERFDEIVDFSGVERFLDTPVKRYSSGMYLRLAFSVAAHLDPDILLVDEILAVGDAEFQRKCISRITESVQSDRSLVFVSHDLDTLERLCSRVIWLEAGGVRDDGDPHDVIQSYLAASLGQADGPSAVGWTEGPLTVKQVTVAGEDHQPTDALPRDREFSIRVEFRLDEEIPGFDLAIVVSSAAGVVILDQTLQDATRDRLPVGEHVATLTVPPILNVGQFKVGIWCGTSTEDLIEVSRAASFSLYGLDHDRPDRAVVVDLPMTVSTPSRSR
jgi:ABC-2 type transport system ATP-binding protein/lipopolysaccharide transport system ATP-binding protein